ncbi:FecR family protein [Mucilaginibacter sp. FT3.2]|uniref:FecR family protein n=1 Tax=Mucilaginibacter sp. FT3.2 TaxID=2723090 RepID=UPI00161492C6|nr:FecR family protein [Mucilaginibacter sp. FT3.2]MBB6229766.1 ferric-dicitrate binding protein FerR (iron transport regulator) [Mucilaginibacter sp. FT3.2]
MENKEQPDILIKKFLNRQCTVDEINVLMQAFGQPQNEEALKAAILDYFETAAGAETEIKPDVEAAVQEVHYNLITQIRKDTAVGRSRYRLMWSKFAAAAAILIFISAGVYFYLNKEGVKPPLAQMAVKQLQNDILPGGNKAVLTLGNGKKIELDDVKNGIVARQNGTATIKTKSGQLVSRVESGNKFAEELPVSYNTITTARGGQYQVILPDGSKVWLNAASSLKYPTAFKGSERNVELTGEAYFEVAKNAAMPFYVKSAGQTVKVLGTHFNINAYEDERVIKTTLLEGSIQIAYQQVKALIKPGETARITLGLANKIMVDEDLDTGDAVAWKDGYFQFNHSDIQTVMRQISRWYDVTVIYKGTVPSKDFGGAIQRNLSLSQVLHILEKSQLHFIIKGKEVVVMQ